MFQVYNETGAAGLSVLEAVTDWAISDVLCDVGALSLTLPLDTVGAEHLLVDADRQVRVLMAGAPDMWFVADDDAWAGVSDHPGSELRQVACRGLAAVFDEWFLDGAVTFENRNPGDVVATVFAAGQSAGFFQGVTLLGGGTADASGNPWPTSFNVDYDADKSLLAIMKQLTDARLMEWRMVGRQLRIYAPNGLLSSLPGVLQPGGDVLSAPVTRSRRSVATHVQVAGDEATPPTIRSQALPGRRQRMTLLQQPTDSAVDPAVAGDLYLAAHAAPDVQLSHELADSADWVPWVTYRPGDQLPTVAAGDGVELWRVQQVAARGGVDGVQISVELGSLLKVAEERLADQVAVLSPGVRVLG
ncbi:hypothetical protein KIH74_22880 [Kineosporia sp. J2-2]|uniref:Minor tail protein n=1 Tax=Kineosporia corallincola TaxID=2835133 RepID=A0ABS5TQC0_9ACTN|nr:hypothetical protein [Kineosporia corallincola]MBT0771804.1 hypothetical protein [Kineosporia corallincola]